MSEEKDSKITQEQLHQARQASPQEIGSVYLHLSNSGISFSVVDEGWGPTIKVSQSTFGNLSSEMAVHTDTESLRQIGEMFLAAAQYPEYTEEYCNSAVVDKAEKNHQRLVEFFQRNGV